MTPPPTRLGRFRLEPSAGCGDMISVRRAGSEQAFVIKKVSYVYEYASGGYKMVGKGVKVKRVSREGVESFLERMLPSGKVDEAAMDVDARLEPPRRAEDGVA